MQPTPAYVLYLASDMFQDDDYGDCTCCQRSVAAHRILVYCVIRRSTCLHALILQFFCSFSGRLSGHEFLLYVGGSRKLRALCGFYVFVQAEDWNFTVASLQRPPKRVQNTPLKYCARFYTVVCCRRGGRLSYAFCRCFMMVILPGC